MSASPIASVRSALFDLIDGQYAGYTVYENFPNEGVGPKSITLQHVSGSESGSALGRTVSTTEVGNDVRVRFQIDVYSDNHADCESVADSILQRILANKVRLKKDRGIEDVVPIVITDVGSSTPGERIYRKLIDLEVYTYRIMTRPAD